MSKYLIAASLACTLLAGCGSSEGGGSAGGGGGMPGNWKATDACGIVDKAEMAEVMRSAVSEASLSMVHEPDEATAGVSECGYILADGSRVSVLTRWSPISDNSAESIATTRSTISW